MSGGDRPEENTLGVLIGRRRTGVPAASTAARAVVQANAQGASLGIGHLGMGAGVLCAIEAVYGLAVFATHIGEYPSVLPAVMAWLLFIAAFATVSLTVATRGERFPTWMFIGYLLALGGVVALDFIAIWPLHDIGGHASASVTAGFGLLTALTLRPARELLFAAAALFAAFVAAITLTTPLTAATLPVQLVTISMAVFPPLFGVFVVVRFRRIVQLELDRVLVQSTVSAPRFAVGMLASEELARLDLAAEELLDSVASGRTALPLRPKMASTAASLATELRLHLIEGRRETWLYHAITESEQLGKSATLKDSGSLAGLLDPQQRDGLLAAVWLLVADKKKTGPTAQLVLGPVLPPEDAVARRTITIPIVITTTGVPRGRVDRSIWAALAKVGDFTYSSENSSLRVDLRCIVPNPADQ
ncbi:MAG: hypothetical protein JWL94_2281 [Microbacteriaceae bacterium]|jgi:hypothetical protein|nr:hypothetical protein [Microbacteriaceae bacterium]HEV7956821.1 hypothetical protein [Marisediminicola sp.]